MGKYLQKIKEFDRNMLVKKKELVGKLREELRQSLKLDIKTHANNDVSSPKSGDKSKSTAWQEEKEKVE